jgi:uncharacterized protein (TIGR02611 family)
MDSVSAKGVLHKLSHALRWDQVPKGIRRIIIGVIGGTVLLIGVALIVLPGPAIVVIPVGLAILATEFAWARRYLQKARDVFKKKNNRVGRSASEQK